MEWSEPELRCPCGTAAARSEERLVDQYAEARYLGWALVVRTYVHKLYTQPERVFLTEVWHALPLGPVFPAAAAHGG